TQSNALQRFDKDIVDNEVSLFMVHPLTICCTWTDENSKINIASKNITVWFHAITDYFYSLVAAEALKIIEYFKFLGNLAQSSVAHLVLISINFSMRRYSVLMFLFKIIPIEVLDLRTFILIITLLNFLEDIDNMIAITVDIIYHYLI
ncbi:hypothetical protein ACJX0J_015836, partial [Zea mays]